MSVVEAVGFLPVFLSASGTFMSFPSADTTLLIHVLALALPLLHGKYHPAVA